MAVIRKRPADSIVLGKGSDPRNTLQAFVDRTDKRLGELTPAEPATYSVVAADIAAALVAAGLMAPEGGE